MILLLILIGSAIATGMICDLVRLHPLIVGIVMPVAAAVMAAVGVFVFTPHTAENSTAGIALITLPLAAGLGSIAAAVIVSAVRLLKRSK